MRICLVANRFPILGRATDIGFLWPLAKGLVQKGHEVVVIAARSPLGRREIHRDGVRVIYLFEGGSEFLHLSFEKAVIAKFVELHKEKPFDLVHSLDSSGARIGRLKKKGRFAFAIDVGATGLSEIFAILGMARSTVGSLLATGAAVAYRFLTSYLSNDRRLLKYADGVFVSSDQQRVFLERYYLYPDDAIATVPYGVEFKESESEPDVKVLERHGIPEGSHIVLTVSEMAESSELSNVLKAFERVAIKKSNAYLVIVGDGPEFKAIEFQMLSLALGSRTVMTGALSVDEISQWVAASDVYVDLSSRATSVDPVMIDAMMQKKVIIASELSSLAPVVEEGIDGFLIRPADVDSLAHLLLELFSGSFSLSEIGSHAQIKVKAMFDLQKMLISLEQAYQKIVMRRDPRWGKPTTVSK